MADIPWTWLLIRGSGITTWALLTAVVAWGLAKRELGEAQAKRTAGR